MIKIFILLIFSFSFSNHLMAEPKSCSLPGGIKISPIEAQDDNDIDVATDVSFSHHRNHIGYMWIGNFDDGTWSKKILSIDDDLSPYNLELEHSYTLITGGLHIKVSMPHNGNHMYIANEAKLHKGHSIELLDTPKSFERDGKTRYWVKVRY